MTATKNHFSLFEISPGFDIDLSELTKRYRDLQNAVHPDKFSNSADQEKLQAVQRAAQVNDAFSVLKSPLLRAQYLLKLNGVTAENNGTISDPMFLMQQMDIRESLEFAATKDDALSAVEDVIDEIDAMYRALISEIRTMFAAALPNYDEINLKVLQLHFFNRLKNEAEVTLANIENK